jgi:NADH-quinone oxidoreductase subunit H
MNWQAANGPILFHWSMIPAAIAMLLVIPCEIGAHPFDVAEAETEICEGMLAEYSGRPLAVFKLSHCVKMYVMTALFCAMFLGGLSTGIVALDVVIVIALCTVVTFVSMTVPHAVCARLKVEQVFKFYWTVVAGLAAISAILVWFGL